MVGSGRGVTSMQLHVSMACAQRSFPGVPRAIELECSHARLADRMPIVDNPGVARAQRAGSRANCELERVGRLAMSVQTRQHRGGLALRACDGKVVRPEHRVRAARPRARPARRRGGPSPTAHRRASPARWRGRVPRARARRAARPAPAHARTLHRPSKAKSRAFAARVLQGTCHLVQHARRGQARAGGVARQRVGQMQLAGERKRPGVAAQRNQRAADGLAACQGVTMASAEGASAHVLSGAMGA